MKYEPAADPMRSQAARTGRTPRRRCAPGRAPSQFHRVGLAPAPPPGRLHRQRAEKNSACRPSRHRQRNQARSGRDARFEPALRQGRRRVMRGASGLAPAQGEGPGLGRSPKALSGLARRAVEDGRERAAARAQHQAEQGGERRQRQRPQRRLEQGRQVRRRRRVHGHRGPIQPPPPPVLVGRQRQAAARRADRRPPAGAPPCRAETCRPSATCAPSWPSSRSAGSCGASRNRSRRCMR